MNIIVHLSLSTQPTLLSDFFFFFNQAVWYAEQGMKSMPAPQWKLRMLTTGLLGKSLNDAFQN